MSLSVTPGVTPLLAVGLTACFLGFYAMRTKAKFKFVAYVSKWASVQMEIEPRGDEGTAPPDRFSGPRPSLSGVTTENDSAALIMTECADGTNVIA
jgi:hypothetical protein